MSSTGKPDTIKRLKVKPVCLLTVPINSNFNNYYQSRQKVFVNTHQHLGEDTVEQRVEEKRGDHLVHIHARKTGRGVEVKIHSLRAGERRFLTIVIIIFEEINVVGNGKGRVR